MNKLLKIIYKYNLRIDMRVEPIFCDRIDILVYQTYKDRAMRCSISFTEIVNSSVSDDVFLVDLIINRIEEAFGIDCKSSFEEEN